MRPLEAGRGRPPLKDLVSVFPDLFVRRIVSGDVTVHQQRQGGIERILEIHPIYERRDQQEPFVAIRVSDVPRGVRPIGEKLNATYILKPVGMDELEISVGEKNNPNISFQEVLETARRGFDILMTSLRTDRQERDRYTRTVRDDLGSRDIAKDMREADLALGTPVSAVLYDLGFASRDVAVYMHTILQRNSVM